MTPTFKYSLVAVGVFILAAVFMGVYVFIRSGEPVVPTETSVETPWQPSYTSSVTPSGSGSDVTPDNSLTVLSADGQSILVKDFKKDPSVTAFPNNSGDYVLAGGLDPNSENAPYSILYVESDQSFNISLWAEPLGTARTLAEQDLLTKLGINQSTACQLRYQVLTTARVNPLYAGKNLGFSFCPGATPL